MGEHVQHRGLRAVEQLQVGTNSLTLCFELLTRFDSGYHSMLRNKPCKLCSHRDLKNVYLRIYSSSDLRTS